MRDMPQLPPDDSLRAQAREWLLRLRSGHATDADARAFAGWRAQSPAHEQAARDVGRTWQRMRTASAASLGQAPAAGSPRGLAWWGQRVAHMDRRAFLGGAVAAGAAWLALRPPLQLWPSLEDAAAQYRADYHTDTGEQRQVEPAAGLQVAMNTRTRLDVRAPGAIELLNGEAEIIAGQALPGNRPPAGAYTIFAGAGRIQAHAARLNVRCTGTRVEISCLEGVAELQHPLRRVTLGPAQQLNYGADSLGAPVPVDPAIVTAWRRGLLVFDNVPLADVVDEINRYRPGRVVLRNAALGQTRVRAQFSIDRFEQAFALIQEVYGARVSRWPGGIVVLS